MQVSLDATDLRPIIAECVAEALRQMTAAQAKPAEPLLLTIKQAAKRLNLSASTVYLLTKADAIKAVRVGTAVRYAPSDLEAWIEAAKAAEVPS